VVWCSLRFLFGFCPDSRGDSAGLQTLCLETSQLTLPDTESAPPKPRRKRTQLGNGLPTSEPHWTCHLTYPDPDYDSPCPRCGKPCHWMASVTIFSRGPISQGTLHSPLCPCPDEHIVQAIARIIADAILKDYLESKARESADATQEAPKTPST
jgi:hypothetical protein